MLANLLANPSLCSRKGNEINFLCSHMFGSGLSHSNSDDVGPHSTAYCPKGMSLRWFVSISPYTSASTPQRAFGVIENVNFDPPPAIQSSCHFWWARKQHTLLIGVLSMKTSHQFRSLAVCSSLTSTTNLEFRSQ